MWTLAVHTKEGIITGCFLWKLVAGRCMKRGPVIPSALRSTQQVHDLPKQPVLGSPFGITMIQLRVICPVFFRSWVWVDYPACCVGTMGMLIQISLYNQAHISTQSTTWRQCARWKSTFLLFPPQLTYNCLRIVQCVIFSQLFYCGNLLFGLFTPSQTGEGEGQPGFLALFQKQSSSDPAPSPCLSSSRSPTSDEPAASSVSRNHGCP